MKKIFPLFLIFLSINLIAQIPEHADIKGPFNSPQEVTESCLSCHEDAAKTVMATSHWTWLSPEPLSIPQVLLI